MVFQKKYFVLLISVLFFVGGCASTKVVPSGFLNDYSRMESSVESKQLLIDKRLSEAIEGYSKVMIDPVIIYFHVDAKGTGIDPVKLKDLAYFFENELKSIIGEDYEIVDSFSDGVLRVRAAITDVRPNKRYLNLHWSTTLAGWGLGGASMEVELLDAKTNERIIAMVDAQKGNRIKYFNGLKKWGHTEDVLKHWAEMISEKISQL